MTMATKAQHAHTNMPSNDQVSYWKSHATVSPIFSFTQVFTDKKVFNFILLLIMTNQNDTREDEQGNDNTDMKTQQPNLMHTPMEERSSAGNRWICYRARLQAILCKCKYYLYNLSWAKIPCWISGWMQEGYHWGVHSCSWAHLFSIVPIWCTACEWSRGA